MNVAERFDYRVERFIERNAHRLAALWLLLVVAIVGTAVGLILGG